MAIRSDSWFYEVFEAPVLKEGEQRLDGVLVPPVETTERPVVILEVQMFADGLFWHRLYAETARYLLQHPGVRHWQAVVLTPRAGLPLGPVELFAEFLERRVTVVNLEDLSRREALEPLEELLTLVVRPEGELGPSSRRLVERQPELSAMIATMLWKRLPHLSLEEVMAIAGIQLAELSETRAYQDILAKGREAGLEQGLEQGRQEGREQGFREEAVELVLRQLRRRFGSVMADDAATIGGLSTAELEDLAEALLEFGSPVDLKAWLVNRRSV